jgi:hypothetical protein
LHSEETHREEKRDVASEIFTYLSGRLPAVFNTQVLAGGREREEEKSSETFKLKTTAHFSSFPSHPLLSAFHVALLPNTKNKFQINDTKKSQELQDLAMTVS